MSEERKQKRRPPRKCLKRLTAAELMEDPEFRRWRCHAPASLKRQAFELIRALARQQVQAVGQSPGSWAARVGKPPDAPP
jgi:hypothetical protein